MCFGQWDVIRGLGKHLRVVFVILIFCHYPENVLRLKSWKIKDTGVELCLSSHCGKGYPRSPPVSQTLDMGGSPANISRAAKPITEAIPVINAWFYVLLRFRACGLHSTAVAIDY